MFPESIECLSVDSVLRGQYSLVRSTSKISRLLVTQASSDCIFAYERVGNPSVLLVYCEGVPELLPGDIWETVIADALSHHARANMSAAVSARMSHELIPQVCNDMKQVAVDVSRELVGWLILSFEDGHLVPLARCIQRVPEEELLNGISSRHRGSNSQFLAASWEVRTRPSMKECGPEWLARGLTPAWVGLATQPGCFRKEPSFSIRQSISVAPIQTKPVPLTPSHRLPTLFEGGTPPQRRPSLVIPMSGLVDQTAANTYVWNLIGSRAALDKCIKDATGIESMSFCNDNGSCFAIELRPSGDGGFITVTLVRKTKSGPVKFKLTLGAGTSGVKVMQPVADRFEVVLDPRAVFGTSPAPESAKRIESLKGLSLSVEFK